MMRECGSCGSAFDERYRYCPWCGTRQRLKVVEYFAGVPVREDEAARGLRVSRYLTDPGHVRFSVWGVGRVEATVSIDEHEARRLVTFLRQTDPVRHRPGLSDRLRQSADALLETLR